MPIDRSKMRRGAEAIDKANEAINSERTDWKPFLSSIYWGDDQDEHYLLILNPLEEIPEVDFHKFVDIGDGMPHQIIARTDPIIGERVDPIERDWKYKVGLANLAIGVLLEPVTEVDADGRIKPTGFKVATRTFDRKIRDDEGETTEETEEVTVPEVGFIAQSPYNFFNQLRSFDASTAAIHTTPLKIKRLGKKDVTYSVEGFHYLPKDALDLTDLLEYIENVAYLQDPEGLLEAIADLDDREAAVVIGNTLLDHKIDELGDADNYNELYEAITEPSRFPVKEKGAKGKSKPKAERKGRPTQRKNTAQTDDVGSAVNAPVEVNDPGQDVKPDAQSKREERMKRLRARAKQARKPEAETEGES